MSKMLERLAKAIAISELGETDSSAIELFAPRFEKHARAALRPLREPTEAMIEALYGPFLSQAAHETRVRAVNSMVDAILDEPEQKEGTVSG